MKKFVFSLQYLLDTHQAKEQAAEQALRLAMGGLREVETELAAVGEVYVSMTETLRRMTGVVNRTDYAMHMRSIDAVRHDIEKLKEMRAERDAEVEHCRTMLREEMIARRVLENLCDRERCEWELALHSEDQKIMDELAAVRWSSRKG